MTEKGSIEKIMERAFCLMMAASILLVFVWTADRVIWVSVVLFSASTAIFAGLSIEKWRATRKAKSRQGHDEGLPGRTLHYYDVEWRLGLWASSPRDAAQQARKLQLDEQASAVLFHVQDPVQGRTVEVDLDDEEE